MTDVDPRAASALRGSAFATIVLLLIEFGIGVNLFGQVPKGDQGKSTFAAFGAALTSGPAALAVHAAIGTLLVVAAVTAFVRALRARQTSVTALCAVGLLAVLGAWFSGSSYVGDHSTGASRGMAYATALAILCYSLVLLVTRASERHEVSPGRSRAAHPES
jgi:hypothetical protein